MAGEKCTERFWKEVDYPTGETGTVCKSGGKKRSRRYGVEDMSVNRDRTVVEQDGDVVKRYVWTTAIATYYRDSDELVLRDGGYKTNLTKMRLNQVLDELGLKIKQRDFNWYINGNGWRSPMHTTLSKHR